jgi:hypothetical protein
VGYQQLGIVTPKRDQSAVGRLAPDQSARLRAWAVGQDVAGVLSTAKHLGQGLAEKCPRGGEEGRVLRLEVHPGYGEDQAERDRTGTAADTDGGSREILLEEALQVKNTAKDKAFTAKAVEVPHVAVAREMQPSVESVG